MPTRRADQTSPERYMSSPAFVERRGVLANAVAAKAQLYRSSRDRSLLFFLQSLSTQYGGLRAVAADLAEACHDHFLGFDSSLLSAEQSQERFAAYLTQANGVSHAGDCSVSPRWLAKFLERLCIDPEIDVEYLRSSKASHAAPYFRDPIGCIDQYREHLKRTHASRVVVTSIGSEVHAALNHTLATRRMGILEGISGSGKSHAAENWCEDRRGEVRFLSLSGITHRTGFFKKLAGALGLSTCQQASSKIQARVEEFLANTKLMLVIDEAHFLWPQHKRTHSAPELVDWVNTALVNQGVPVALIATDQFAKLKSHIEKQVGWTSDQLMHRASRYFKLSEQPTRKDLFDVAQSLLSHRWDEADECWIFDPTGKPDVTAVKLAALYGKSNLLPLPAVRSIVDHARINAREDGRTVASLRDVQAATTAQEISDVAIRSAFERTPKARRWPASADTASGLQSNRSSKQVSRFPADRRPEETIRNVPVAVV